MPDLQNIIGDEGDILRRGAGGALTKATTADLVDALSGAFASINAHAGVFTTVEAVAAGVTGTNRTVYQQIHGGGTITQVTININASSGNIAIAAYENNPATAWTIGDRLITSGPIACPAAGVRTVSLGGSVTLRPGDWLALWTDNATASFWGSGSATLQTGAIGPVLVEGSTAAPPATPAPTAHFQRRIIMLGH